MNDIDRRTVIAGGTAAAVMALLRSAYADAIAATVPARARGAPAAGSQRAFAGNQTVTPLVPGRLYRVGCVVRAERLTWLPQDLDGYEPLNCYVLTDAHNLVFADMGAPIMLPAVQAAVDMLAGERKVWLSFSRNEADCIGNLGYLLGTCQGPTLLFGGAGGILEWINDPHVDMLEVRDFLGRIPIVESRNDSSREIGEIRLRWMDARLKQMLMTQWAYESGTGCLFTSEAFGFRHLATADSPVVIDRARDLPPVATVAREIAQRANWMREAQYPDYLRKFEQFFRDNDVRMLAPVHGCVIRGRDAVAAHVMLLRDAMRAASALPDTERLRYA